MSVNQRRAEIEAKRAKLAELRKARQDRQAERRISDTVSSTYHPLSSST